MKRRQILAGFTGTLMGTFLFNFTYAKRKVSGILGNEKSLGPHTVSKRYQSVLYPAKNFSSTADFWSHHPDPAFGELNKRFQEKGLLLRTNSELLKDGKTVELTKVFKDSEAHELYKRVAGLFHSKAKDQPDLRLI
ncbi:MAG: hypothetical protein K9K67_08395 [Bacteriovoracaceae bacterium]|nr:hypothetical protein [Bacteriovoracaceae bacterium]